MLNIRRIAAVIAGVALATASFAASVVGTWHGHFDLSQFKAPAGMDPHQVQQSRDMMSKVKITLTFKGDKTYSTTFVGLPGSNAPHNGTWTQAGNAVTTKPSKAPQRGPSTLTFTLSRDGKSLTASPQGSGGVRVVFTR